MVKSGDLITKAWCDSFEIVALAKLEKSCMMHIRNFNDKVVY